MSNIKYYDGFLTIYFAYVTDCLTTNSLLGILTHIMKISAMAVTGKIICRTLLIIAFFVMVIIMSLTSRSEIIETFTAVKDMTGRHILNDINYPDSTSDDRMIHAVERYNLEFDAGGYMFAETGRYLEITEQLITSCLVHSFSPYVEQQAAKRFLDPARDNIYFANSPAILWHGPEIILVSRVWLDREKYEARNDWPSNHFADNWLYYQRYDSHMRPTTNGSILGIPSPKQWWVGDGPIEPRLFKCQGRVFVMFNAAMAFSQKYYMDYSVMWDLKESVPIIPRIEGGSPMINATEKDDMPRDKHWMSLINNDTLYFVHNLDPLRILHCTLTGTCKFIHREISSKGFIFSDSSSHLRGGTPFEPYEWPYYISVAHTTMYKTSNNHRFYTAHIVVLCVKPYRVVYVSNDIKIHEKLYKTAPMVRDRYIDDGFIFPVGLILEDPDNMSIGVHINDYSSVIIRLKGIRKLLSKVIKMDKRKNPLHGPPVSYLQQHIHDVLVNMTHMQMVH